MGESVEFGDSARKLFMLDEKGTLLNNGSFGATPVMVMELKQRIQIKVEDQPDVHRHTGHPGMIKENLKKVADFLKADLNNMTFVSNTTAAMNAVLKSLPLEEGDGILTYMCTYDSCKNICDFLQQHKDVKNVALEFQPPVNTIEEVVDAYDSYIAANPHIKVVLLVSDYISSFPTVMLSIKELITVCKKHDKIAIVDGAQAPGQVSINLEELGADFFTGDLHKWLFVARASGFLWVAPRFHKMIFPAITSKSWDSPCFQDRFEYMGAGDYTPHYCVGAAIDFYNSLGGLERISSYCKGLLNEAVDYLIERWGTGTFQ